MRIVLTSTFVLLFAFGILGCDEATPSTSMVRYMVTNRSANRINRLTIVLEENDAPRPRPVDSTFITNIPENLPIRLTYDISKSAWNGNYRLIASGNKKIWTTRFGKFTPKQDHDPDHLYNLEIMEDSVVLIP
jgi:hypothetical protein